MPIARISSAIPARPASGSELPVLGRTGAGAGLGAGAATTGAGFAGTPQGLARALDKLGRYSKKLPMNANPSTAHMFIVNPLSGRSLMSLFSTHPPLEERIARLR